MRITSMSRIPAVALGVSLLTSVLAGVAMLAPLVEESRPVAAQTLTKRSTLAALAADSASGSQPPAPTAQTPPTATNTVVPLPSPTQFPEPEPTPYDYYPY